MRAVILAAGVGRRLGDSHQGPKCLLRFAGRSLLQRHLETLAGLGVRHIAVCVGFEAGRLRDAIHAGGAGRRVTTVLNPDYREGSVVSLWTMRHYLTAGGDVLLMDADVLYGPAILQRLADTTVPNCLLLDRDFEAGDEPVKICVRDGAIVEFRKQVAPDLQYDSVGESVGFFRLSAPMATRLAALLERYVETGRRDAPYEDVLRDLILESPAGFGFEDVTGVPWIEIDYPEDVRRAAADVLPLIDAERLKVAAQPS